MLARYQSVRHLPTWNLPACALTTARPSSKLACLQARLPIQHRPRGCRLVGAAAEGPREAALEPTASSSGLEVPRRGYRSFKLDACEFLVAETPDGFLDLSDVFMAESRAEGSAESSTAGAGGFQRAPTSGDIPSGPHPYQEAEWAATWGGNIFEGQPAETRVFKVYLIPLASVEPYRLDLSRAFCLDGATRSLRRCEVLWLAPQDTDVNDLRLRIREGVLTVDAAESLPSVERVVQAARMGNVRAMSRLEVERAAAEGISPEELAVQLQPLEEAADSELTSKYDDEGFADEENLRDFVPAADEEGDYDIDYDDD